MKTATYPESQKLTQESTQSDVEYLLKTPSGNTPVSSAEEMPALESDTSSCKRAKGKTAYEEKLLAALEARATYNREGYFVYLDTPRGVPAKMAGQILGDIDKYGYWKTSLCKAQYNISHLVWLWHHGELPPAGLTIDHLDRNTSNNRIENLRCISNKLQQRNKRKSARNSTGETGVVDTSLWSNNSGSCENRYMAKVGTKYLKRYPTIELAKQARQDYLKEHPELGYTEHHGT